MEPTCSIAGDCAELLSEERHGALLWLGAFGRKWQLVYERYDGETGMLAMVHRHGLAFKATVLHKVSADHLAIPWWIETFLGGEYDDRVEAIGRAEEYIATKRRENRG
jgi:hypothetical protein